MPHFPWARKSNSKQRELFSRLGVARVFATMLSVASSVCVPVGWCAGLQQDSGSQATEYFGNGAEINVIVHDGTGNPISSPAMVRLYRDGNIPSGEGATLHGRVRFVVTSLGEFIVVVERAGHPSLEKDVSVRTTGQKQVDVYLQPNINPVTSTATTGASGSRSAKVILA